MVETSFWDHHVAIAALGLPYYGPVNKVGLTCTLGACYLSTCPYFIYLFIYSLTACSIGKSKYLWVWKLISKNRRGYKKKKKLLQMRSFAESLTKYKMSEWITVLTFRKEKMTKWCNYCAIPPSNYPNDSKSEQVLGIKHNVTSLQNVILSLSLT